jgi:hypothetical protein
MAELNFELPDGVTLNEAEPKQKIIEEAISLKKLSCPKCKFVIQAIIFDNYGRFSGKIVVNVNNDIWQGKLASNPDKSKKQIIEVFNKKVKDHLEKCKG